MNYFVRKLGFYVVALWAALTLNFLIPRLLPGNPVDILLAKLQQRGGHRHPATPARRTSSSSEATPPSRCPVQYWNYLINIFKGDLGVSVGYFPTPVTEVIGSSLPWTIVLVGLATVHRRVARRRCSARSSAGSRAPGSTRWCRSRRCWPAVPYFWLALILVYLLATRPCGCSRSQGGYDVVLHPGLNWQFISSAIEYGFLPALTIVIASIGGWLLGMRNMMVSTLSEDYVLTAQAKGLSRAASCAATRPATPCCRASPASPSRSASWSPARSSPSRCSPTRASAQAPLGACTNNDYALMQGIFLFITLAVLGANLVVDLLYGIIDPRTRGQRPLTSGGSTHDERRPRHDDQVVDSTSRSPPRPPTSASRDAPPGG